MDGLEQVEVVVLCGVLQCDEEHDDQGKHLVFHILFLEQLELALHTLALERGALLALALHTPAKYSERGGTIWDHIEKKQES